MTLITIPTPLRSYTDGQKQVEVEGETIGLVIKDLATRYPDLKQHLFNESGDLRPYVNIFVNQDDIRTLDGENTPVMQGDRLMIVPSIAGGMENINDLIQVDHAAIRTNQSLIISILLIAFIIDAPSLVIFTSLVMFVGTLLRRPGFSFIYDSLRRLRFLKPEKIMDHPEPHLFAQGFGGVVLSAAILLFLNNLPIVGWTLTWIVIILASLNVFSGFCLGCAVYYLLNRFGIPWFGKTAPEGRIPGVRPSKEK